ncbi:hypothetical protein L9F63_003550, partial [Diploptera punctata]
GGGRQNCGPRREHVADKYIYRAVVDKIEDRAENKSRINVYIGRAVVDKVADRAENSSQK